MTIFKNIVTNYSAVADGAYQTATVSITSGLKTLTSTTNFSPMPVAGQGITVPGAGSSGTTNLLVTTIDIVTDAKTLILHDAASNTLSGSSQTITWGTDNQPFFDTWLTFAQAQSDDLDLTIPAGAYYISTNGYSPFQGIITLAVQAIGASILCPIRLTGNGNFMQTTGFSAAVQTVNIGDTSAVCLTPAQASIMAVGRYGALSAQEWQGTSGYPPNFQRIQFIKFLSNNASTGVVTWDIPAIEAYSQTYAPTSSGSYYTGGPASLFLLDNPQFGTLSPHTAWNTTVTVNGLTVVNNLGPPGHQIYFPGLSVDIADMTFTRCAPIPSVNKHFKALRCSVLDDEIEVDKDCEYVEWNTCSLRSMTVQSASIQMQVFDNTSFTGNLNGTARRTVLRNDCSMPTLGLGPNNGFGASESVTIDGTCSIGSIIYFSASANNLISDLTQSNQNLTYNTSGVMSWGAIGSRLFLSGSNRTNGGYPTTVSNVLTTGGEPTLVSQFPSPFPTLPSFMGAPFFVQQHPCPSITVSSGASGCPEIVDLATAPPGLPLFSHALRISDFSVAQTIEMWGRLVSISVNVTQAYTGVQGACFLHAGGIFDNAEMIGIDNTRLLFGPIINAKITGNRIILGGTPAAPSGSVSGAQAGDTLGASPGFAWFVESIGPQLSIDVSGEAPNLRPIITLEILTDQNQRITAPLLSGGLALRLHA